MRADARASRWVVGLAVAVAVALALWLLASLLRADADIVSIVAHDLDEASGSWSSATWRENGASRSVRSVRSVLLRVTDAALEAGREVEVVDKDGKQAVARLILGEASAVLLYHAASRDSDFGTQLLSSRLARLETGQQEFRLALVLAPEAPRTTGGAALHDLEVPRAARLVALAQALGAWDRLRRGRFPRRPDGRPFLPFFVPREPGDWKQLIGTSLVGFLPEPLARYVAETPGLRQASYGHLSSFARRIPALEASLVELADAVAPAVAPAALEELRDRLRRSAEAYLAYLDSVWIESIATLVAPDEARISLYVHTLLSIEIEELAADLPRRLVLFEKDVIGGLRLRDPSTGRVIRVQAERKQLRFPIGKRVEPVQLGPYRFGSTRIDFVLEGLANSEALRAHLVDALRPRVRKGTTGEAVAADHIRHLSAVDDPRFSAVGEETRDEFLSALPSRVQRRSPGGGGVRWDASGPTLSLSPGLYDVGEDLILPPGAQLHLAAGVELQMQPGRSILVRGPLRIDGTATAPVRIRGSSADEPWGVLAVQGKGFGALDANAGRPVTEIRYLELEGGSEDYLRGAYYSGQLSVYHQDLVLIHTILRRSHADDSLNAKYAKVTIRHSAFLDSAADAVDLDWVEGSISHSLFAGMGPEGDGVDVSGSRVVLEESVISDAQDKCLSVGERSTVEVRGVLLRSCSIALASKDLSRTELRESLLLDNERDLAAYRKKPIFGGGRILGSDLLLVGARSGAQRDAESEIVVKDSIWIGGARGDIEQSGSTLLPRDSEPVRAIDFAALAARRQFSADAYRRIRGKLR